MITAQFVYAAESIIPSGTRPIRSDLHYVLYNLITRTRWRDVPRRHVVAVFGISISRRRLTCDFFHFFSRADSCRPKSEDNKEKKKNISPSGRVLVTTDIISRYYTSTRS